jgi:hypothetical protein
MTIEQYNERLTRHQRSLDRILREAAAADLSPEVLCERALRDYHRSQLMSPRGEPVPPERKRRIEVDALVVIHTRGLVVADGEDWRGSVEACLRDQASFAVDDLELDDLVTGVDEHAVAVHEANGRLWITDGPRRGLKGIVAAPGNTDHRQERRGPGDVDP